MSLIQSELTTNAVLIYEAFTFVSKFAPATQSGNSFHRAHINFPFFSCLCFRRYLCFFIFIFLFNKTKSQIKQQQAFSTNMQDTLRWALAKSVDNENGGKLNFRNGGNLGPSCSLLVTPKFCSKHCFQFLLGPF